MKDEYKLVKESSQYCICIVEKSGKTKPVKLGISANLNGHEKSFRVLQRTSKYFGNERHGLYVQSGKFWASKNWSLESRAMCTWYWC